MLESEGKRISKYFVELNSKNTEAVINGTLEYYVSHARMYKALFIILNIAVLSINCSIPFINQVFGSLGSTLISLLSSIAAFITGISAFINFMEKWKRYRTSAERLKTECNLFNSGCGKYAGLTESEKENRLVEIFEEINSNDVSTWKSEISKSNEERSNNEKEPVISRGNQA